MSGVTPSQTVGPFLHIGLSDSFGARLDAAAIRLHGSVLDGAGDPVPDAVVELWAARVGLVRSDTRGDGRFAVEVRKPPATEGAPCFEVAVFARGLLKQVVTRVYFPDEAEANAVDPVLAGVDPDRRSTLVAVEETDGSLRFDIRLQGPGETVCFEP